MLELGIGASLVRGLGWLFWGLFALALCAAVWRPKTKPRKLAYTLLVLAIFFGPLVPGIYQNYEYQQRLKVAQALFAERCKTAGEKIYRTVEGVEGILLMNERVKVKGNIQFDLNDPAGDSVHNIGYVETFLMGHETDVLLSTKTTKGAYRYVDLIDSNDKQKYRYIGKPTPKPSFPDIFDFVVTKTNVSQIPPLYGVIFKDISTSADRSVWVAGSSIQVFNVQTNELLAERIDYIFDVGQGSTINGLDPWEAAANNACPIFPKLHDRYPYRRGLTRNFVEKVLKPVQGE